MKKTLNLKLVISKYKNIFAKGYTLNQSKEVFLIKKVKNAVPWTFVISDLNGKEIVGTFQEKEFQKTNQREFRTEKVMKKNVMSSMLNGQDTIICVIAGQIKKSHSINE